MNKSHAAARMSEQPTFAQLKELMGQIDSGRVSKDRIQRFLRGEDRLHALPVETILNECLPSNVELDQLPKDIVSFWEQRFPGFGKVMTARLWPLSHDFIFPSPAPYAEALRMCYQLRCIQWQRQKSGYSSLGLSSRYSSHEDFLCDFGSQGERVLEEYVHDLEDHIEKELERVDYLLRMIVGMEIKPRLDQAYEEFWDHYHDLLFQGPLESIDPHFVLDEETRLHVSNNFDGAMAACLAGTFLPESNERDGSWGLLQMWLAGVYPVGYCRDSVLFISG